MSQQSTEIEPYLQRGHIVLKDKPGASLQDVAKEMADPYRVDVARVEDVPFPALPKPLKIDDKVREALKALPEVFGKVNPETRRTLTPEENHDVYVERESLKCIEALLKKRIENLNTIIRTHMDVDAEERGVAVPKAVVDAETGEVIVEATDRDKDGHYILAAPQNPERATIDGENMEWSREYGKGTTSFSADHAALLKMYEDGEITREVYLSVTREVRVFDEAKAYAALRNESLRDHVLRVIHRFTTVGKPHTKLFARKPQN